MNADIAHPIISAFVYGLALIAFLIPLTIGVPVAAWLWSAFRDRLDVGLGNGASPFIGQLAVSPVHQRSELRAGFARQHRPAPGRMSGPGE